MTLTPVAGSRPFVGRAPEARMLRGALADVHAGRARCVLVTGEAGIGKTRLVEEIVGELPPRAVVWGRCHETEGAPAFWPWIQVLRGLARQRDAAELRSLAGTAAADLAKFLPSLAKPKASARASASEAAPAPTDAAASSRANVDPETARFRLFDAVASFLKRIGGQEPVAVVLDDLHWADHESLLLLNHVASELRDARVLLLATYRDAEPRMASAALRLLAALTRVAERVSLPGLSQEDVAEVLAAGEPHGEKRALAEAVHRASGGNPFFVGEIAELLRGESDVAEADGPIAFRVPDTVREAIRRRLDPMPEETRILLRSAAVLGLEVVVDALAELRGTTSRDVLAQLEPAFRAGIVVEAVRPGRYRFAHALTQDTLLDELDAVERAQLHMRAGEALERLYDGDLTPLQGELAYHFLRAAPVGGLARAILYATRAGDRAMTALGFDEAAGHYERALQADQATGSDPQRRFELLLKLGNAQRWSGDEDAAYATLREAARLAKEHGDGEALARAAVRVVNARAETGEVDRTLVELLEAALAALGPDDRALRARVLGALARTLYFAPDPAQRDELSREALDVARRAGDPATLAAVLTDRHFALWRAGTVHERLALADETIALAEQTAQADVAIEAREWRVLDLLELGRFADADREVTELASIAERMRVPRVLWHSRLVRAARALYDGRLAEAEALATKALHTRSTFARNNAAQFHALQTFHIRLAQGRIRELAADLTLLTGRPGVPPIWRCGIALMEIACGRPEAARPIVAELIDDDFGPLPRDATWLGALSHLAELCDELEDAERAARVHEALLPYAGLTVVSGVNAAIHGPVERYLGLAALAMGKPEVAVSHLEAALAEARGAGAHAEIVRSESTLARALATRGRAGDRERSDALASEAAARAASLGAPGLVEGLRAKPDSSEPAENETARAAAGTAAGTAGRSAAGRSAARASLRREGDFWTLSSGSEVTRLKDTKGVGYLCTLLRHPGEEFHALDLAGGEPTERVSAGDAGEAIDADAARAYRRRLQELTRAIEAGGKDVGRLRSEHDAIERELARATGLGGRTRRSSSDAERARLNVTRAIAAVVRKIAAECPAVGRHLEATVRTGTFCSYEPDPAFPLDWDT